MTSLTRDNLTWCFEFIIQDLREILAAWTVNDIVRSSYLVGSSVHRIPEIISMKDQRALDSDIDILIFIAPEAKAEIIRSLAADLLHSPREGWGVYSNLHIGLRVRPASRVEQTVNEYTTWGDFIPTSTVHLTGRDYLSGPAFRCSLVPTQDEILANMLSKAYISLQALEYVESNSFSQTLALQTRTQLARGLRKLCKLRVMLSSGTAIYSKQRLHAEEWTSLAHQVWCSTSLAHAVSFFIDPEKAGGHYDKEGDTAAATIRGIVRDAWNIVFTAPPLPRNSLDEADDLVNPTTEVIPLSLQEIHFLRASMGKESMPTAPVVGANLEANLLSYSEVSCLGYIGRHFSGSSDSALDNIAA